MADIPNMEIDVDQFDKTSMQLISAMSTGDQDAFEAVPYIDGRVGTDWIYKERDPETGEFTGKTKKVTQRQLQMELATVKDMKPRIEAIDGYVDGLATRYQKNMDDWDTRRKRYNGEEQFDTAYNQMDEDELDIY